MGMPFSFRRFLFGIAVIGSFCYPVKTHAQIATNTDRYDTANIYYQALSAIVKDSNYKKYKMSPDTIFIQSNSYVGTDSIITEIGSCKFIVLNQDDLYEQLRKKKKFILWEISPLQYSDKHFLILCSLIHASYVTYHTPLLKRLFHKYRAASFGVSDGYNVYFDFDKDHFNFYRVKSWGI